MTQDNTYKGNNSKPEEMKLTVIVPIFNEISTIEEIVNRVQATGLASELLLVDDGSTDDTINVIQGFRGKLKITWINDNKRLGPADSFMRLLLRVNSNSRCFLFADQDDVWKPNKIERAVNGLKPYKEVAALYCSRLEYVDENLKHLGFSKVPRKISFFNALVENCATGNTIALNQRARELIVQNIPDDLLMHDWWCYLVISALGKMIYDDVPTILYRQHDSTCLV